MEKWEDRKDFNFFPFYLVGNGKSGEMEKVSLYKFTHTPLLKNDDQLKQKSDKQVNNQKKKKEEAITQFIKK